MYKVFPPYADNAAKYSKIPSVLITVAYVCTASLLVTGFKRSEPAPDTLTRIDVYGFDVLIIGTTSILAASSE
jgi:hypothetical protein